MHALTSAFGLHPHRFGKRFAEPVETPLATRGSSTASDLRLFAITFAAGFLFVSILIG